MKRLLFALVLCLALIGFPTQAWAHQVETFFTLGDQLEFQSMFSTGEPFAGAEVTIYAPNDPNQPWLATSTDSQGRFTFVPDESIPGDWEIAIEDSDGDQSHADYWTVPVGDKGIIYDGIVLDATEDQHYMFASAMGPLAMTIGASLSWALYKRLRRLV